MVQFRGYAGTMEKKMETAIRGLGCRDLGGLRVRGFKRGLGT